MTHSDPAFSPAEYDRRLAKTRKAMAAKGIDCLFMSKTRPTSGGSPVTKGWSFYVHQGALIFLDTDPIWWGRQQDTNGALRTVWMSDERVFGICGSLRAIDHAPSDAGSGET